MAVVALGMDLANIQRIEDAARRRGQRFLDRIYTAAEQAYCERRKTRFASYAGRFAVKEACMKMLGTGWAQGVRWVDIEVLRPPGQAPTVRLNGAAAEHAARKGIARIHITITHDGGLAAAVAVGETDPA